MPPPGQQPSASWRGDSELTIVFEDGDVVVLDFDTWPGTWRMTRDIGAAIERLCGPNGAWRRPSTLENAVSNLRSWATWFQLHWMARQERDLQRKGLADITPGMWNAWRLQSDQRFSRITCIARATYARAVLQSSPETTAELRRHLDAARAPRGLSQDTSQTRDSYSKEEFRQIEKAATKVVNAAYRRIQPNIELLTRDPSSLTSVQRDRQVALNHLLAVGAPATDEEFEALGALGTSITCRSNGYTEVKRYRRMHDARAALFLTSEEAVAAAALLVCRQGFNLSTLIAQQRPSGAASAGSVHQLFTARSDKPRRGPSHRYFTTVFSDTGDDSDGWWAQRIRAITEPGRVRLAILGGEERPWLVWAASGYGPGRRRPDIMRWGNDFRHILTRGFDWWPLADAQPSFQRLRRTFLTTITRTPAHNTRTTHLRSYRMLDSATRAEAMAATERALQQAVDHAREQVRMRLINEDVTAPAADTVLASCSDFDHHPDTGTFCVADFFSCLACVNAVATPRHHPRLVLAYDVLDQMRGSIHVEEFERRFAIHWFRIQAVLTNFSREELDRARDGVTKEDREAFRSLLDGTLAAEESS